MTRRNRLQRLSALAGTAAVTIAAALALGACGSPAPGDGDAVADTAAAWPEPGAAQPEDTVPLDRTPPVEPEAPAPAAPAAPGAPGTAAPAQPPAAAGTAMDTLTGRLAVTGAQPMTFVTLQPENGAAVQLFGPYDAELRRLAGAVVRVEGTPATGRMPGPALTVQRYELVSVDGERPYVGVLEERNGAYRLGGPRPVRLIGVPSELAGRTGATVWVVGERDGDAVRLQSYGVIRP